MSVAECDTQFNCSDTPENIYHVFAVLKRAAGYADVNVEIVRHCGRACC